MGVEILVLCLSMYCTYYKYKIFQIFIKFYVFRTFVIPNDLNQLRKSWPKYAQRNVKWIIKPPASARGTGIRVVNRWAQIPKRKPLIVQK